MYESISNNMFCLSIPSKVDTNLPLYEDAFDIVLVDDQTMDIPRAIIDKIINVE